MNKSERLNVAVAEADHEAVMIGFVAFFYFSQRSQSSQRKIITLRVLP